MTITPPRLTLGSIREQDFDALMSIFKNETVKATYMVPDLDTHDAEIRLFEAFRKLSERDDRYVWGIYLNDELIGVINETETHGKTIEMGYALHPAHHNQGYATEAFSAVIDHLFGCGFEEILAGAFSENTASLRVMEKCGMTRTNMIAKIEYRGIQHPCIYYSIKAKHEELK